jgi:predicted TIM-barrel fold metal-dependent hydrolase
MPFNMHAAFGRDGSDSGGWQDGIGGAVFNQMWIHYNNMAKGGPLVHWISGGVFERHPKLQIVVAETGGCYWGVEVINALDEIYDATEMRSTIGKRPMNHYMIAKFRELPKRPSEYFHDHVTLQRHNSLSDWRVIDVIPDNVLWSSDYPHPESSWPLSRSEVEENIAEVKPSLEGLRKFLAGNAASLYKFDLEKLQPIADEIGPVYQA